MIQKSIPLARHESNTKEYCYIHALKGMAILAVTMVHTGASELPGIFGRIGDDGARGVQMFFVISGMLAFRSLHNSFPDRKMSVKGVFHWYLKKAIRLLPLYYAAIVISMLTGSWIAYWLGTEGHVTVQNILMHVFLLHGLFPHYTDSILGVDWYLGVVWIFYLLSPFLFRIIDSLEKSICFVVLVYLINPWINSGLAMLLPIEADPEIYNEYIETFGPFCQFLVYMFGVMLYYLTEQIHRADIKYNKALSYAILLFTVILLYGQVNGAPCLYRFSRHEMFGLFFSMVLVSQAVYPSKILCNPFFILLGKYSYGIYLFQFIWLHFYEKYIHYEGAFDWTIRFLVSVFALLMISLVLGRFFEKPVHEKLKNIRSVGPK